MSTVEETLSSHDVAASHGFTRASFLKGGGALLVGLTVPGAGLLAGEGVAVAAPPPKGKWPLVPQGSLSSWIAVHADGTVTAFVGKVELGMGNQTSLAQLVAEQLDVPFEKINMVMGDTAHSPDQGPTFGSGTIRDGGPQVTLAAAAGRLALLDLASRKLQVPAAKLQTKAGVISATDDASKSVSYGDLVSGSVLQRSMPIKVNPPSGGFGPPATIIGGATPKAPKDFTVVGQSVGRVDIPPKVMATYTYVQDVKVPGMLHGRVIRPPAIGAKLVSVGEAPDGVRILRQKDFLAVVAEREWDAIQAAQNLKTTWTAWKGLPPMGDLYAAIRARKSTETVIETGGDVKKGLAASAKTMEATYTTPIETHGALGPSCAVVDVASDGTITAYSGTQGPNLVRTTIAAAMQVATENVRVVAYPASGCYGRNGSDPVTIDAAIMSKLAGAPVRVQWMRHDEHGWDPKGPATVQDLKAGFDKDGKMVAFSHDAWLPTEFSTTIIGSVLAGRAVGEPSAGGWAGLLLYDVKNKHLLSHNQDNLAAEKDAGVGLVSSWLRSPAQFQLTFAKESFVDELAHAAGMDPIAFRLKNLSDPRLIAVLEEVRGLSGWKASPSHASKKKATGVASGRGVAISLRDGTYNAEVAEVEVDTKTGKIQVKHVWVVEDHGLTVNPRAAMLGIEAGITQSVSRVLLEEVAFDESAVTSLDWHSYPILTFSEAPQVTTKIIERTDVPSTGVGEAHCCPVPAAIGNAVFDAIGVRLRATPFRPDVVKKALKTV